MRRPKAMGTSFGVWPAASRRDLSRPALVIAMNDLVFAREVLFRGPTIVAADFDGDALAIPAALRELPRSRSHVTLLFTRTGADSYAGTAIATSPAIVGNVRPGVTPVDVLTAAPALLLRLQTLRHVLLRAFDARGSTELGEAAEREARAILDLVPSDTAPCAWHQRASRSARHAELAARTCALLTTAPGAPHRLSDDARTLNVSPFHLTRVFRAQIGIPMHQYLIRVRLARALDEIANGERSLSALALRLGFTSHSHFTVTFRRTFGMSPARFREVLSGPWHRVLGAATSPEVRRSA